MRVGVCAEVLLKVISVVAIALVLHGCGSSASSGAIQISRPNVASLNPNSGAVGSSVLVAGTNLGATQGTGTVTFNGIVATPTAWSATSIATTVPTGATTGNVVVTVSGLASNDVNFTVTAPASTISNLNPNSGAVGAPVTITGTNFGASQGTSTVTFEGIAATPTAWSATSIATTVPTGATTGNVVVTVGGLASNGVNFTVTAPASTISNLNPNSGAVGAPVTITGTNFGASQGTSTVTFNGIVATPTAWSATSIATTVPTGATTGNVVVTVSGLASNGVNFTVTAPASTISNLNPNSGAVGAPVTITGTNFGASQGTSTVTFNGIVATPTAWSATSIATTVPTGATTGNVVVTVGGLASNGVNFTVTAPAPTISNLNPNSGAVGAPVTITGTNFGASQGTSTVTFEGIAATPTAWSATSIATTVPTGATTGNVVVTVGGLASTGVNFTVTAVQNITVSVTPKRAGLTVTQPLSVTATTNDPVGVTWTATGGGFSSPDSLSGVPVTYTAPSTAGTYTITASSSTSSTTTASIALAVTDLTGMYTYHNDLARDGANTKEYALTTSTVSTSTFGKLFSCPVDGAVYAQPLWVANMTLSGAKHNVVFVATQHDSLYAFDADAIPCVQLWKASLIDGAHGANSGETTVPSGVPGYLVGIGAGDIAPEVGVTGTPVIDPSTNTLYVVSKSVIVSGPTFYQRLHAIDITTGNEKFGGPANITSSNITYPGTGDGGSTDNFNPRQENQRPGLALVNGIVYVTWASHEDTRPFYGWIVGFNAPNLAIASVFNDTPNAQLGGIWMGGGAPSADANGNIYVITGNGAFDADTGGSDYGDSFLQLSGTLNVSSYFAPSDQANDEAIDNDFGAGGSAVVLNLTTGTLKHLVIGGGKDGGLYLLNGDSMGVFGDSNARQLFNIGTGIFATGAFWNNNFYIAGIDGPLLDYSFNSSTNLFNTPAVSQSSSDYGFPGATPSVSATGSSDGIVWALDNTNYCTHQSPACGPTVLHAYDATNLSTDLWNSSMVSTDAAGNAVKFSVPTVANGKVYVGTRTELSVYGLKPN